MNHDPIVSASTQDLACMTRALELAERGLYTTDPNPRVGCVLVRDGRTVGEGWHARAGEPHAEVHALRAAGSEARGATAYVTLEPCSHTGRTPPCADALIDAGVARVVCATADPNPKVAGGGLARLRATGIPVAIGLMADEARALNVGFFMRFERGRPFIRLKMAMSLDARTTGAAGGQHWITGEAARSDVQLFRARSSAVLTGAGTVRIDDPRLDVRLSYGPWVRQPLRVVLDPDLSCKPESRVFGAGPALIFAATNANDPRPGRRDAQVAVVRVDRAPPESSPDRVAQVDSPSDRPPSALDLHAVLEHLTALQVNELLVEAGPRIAAAFLRADLVDELILYVAPTLLGADAPPLAELRGLAPASLQSFEFRDQRLLQQDLRLILTPRRF